MLLMQKLKIMAGKTGYVGEVVPVTKLALETFPKSFTAPSSANYYARLGFSEPYQPDGLLW